MTNVILYNCACEEMIGKLQQVDAVIVDPPFGVTNNSWDKVIPFDIFWALVKSCLKPNGVVISFAMEPFASRLRLSNITDYKYDIIWNKTRGTNFLNAYNRPISSHEVICIFYAKKGTYNILKTEGDFYSKKDPKRVEKNTTCYRKIESREREFNDGRFPTSVWTVSNFNGCKFGFSEDRTIHQTQKPVWLMERLVCTYTNPGDTVLDFCMGSGTTGVACVRQNRNFIGVENDSVNGYFELSKSRIESALVAPKEKAIVDGKMFEQSEIFGGGTIS